MSEPAAQGIWLARQADAQPGVLARAGRIIADGGRSNDACLRARQYLERALAADPAVMFTRAGYELAARRLDAAARTAHAEILDGLGAVTAELAAVRPVWEQRYAGWDPGPAGRDAEEQLRNGTVMVHGRPGHGIDGAWYARAYHTGTGRPAIVITASTGSREIIPFGSTQQARAWLSSRAPGAAGPVALTGGRAAREEAVLAWLLREPARIPAAAAMLAARAWSAHLRAELFAALRWLADGGGRPDHEVIARTLERRLLRAPGWAAADIGWPDADRAHSYLTRLTSTRVSETQARHAARALTPAPSPPAPAPSAVPLQQPPQRPPHPAGPVPRM